MLIGQRLRRSAVKERGGKDAPSEYEDGVEKKVALLANKQTSRMQDGIEMFSD